MAKHKAMKRSVKSKPRAKAKVKKLSKAAKKIAQPRSRVTPEREPFPLSQPQAAEGFTEVGSSPSEGPPSILQSGEGRTSWKQRPARS